MSEEPPDPATAWARLREEAHQLLADALTNPRLAEILSAWIADISASDPALGSRDILLASKKGVAALSSLRRSAGEAWADALEGKTSSTSAPTSAPTPAVMAAAGMLFGHAVGLATGRNPNSGAINRAEALLELFEWSAEGCGAGMHAALVADTAAYDRLRLTLLERANCFTAAPRRAVEPYRVNTCEMVQRHWEHPSIRDYWDEPPYFAPQLRASFAFDALRRVDRRAYLEVLEAFPHPEPVRQALEAANPDEAEITTLLAAGRQAFDEAGCWLPTTKTTFFLLELATRLLLGLPECDDQRFTLGARSVIEAVMARPDGSYVGFAWAERLIPGERRRRGRAHLDPGVEARARRLIRLLEMLSEVIPDHPAPLPWVREQGDIWRRTRLAAALLPYCRNGHPTPDGALELVEKAARDGLFDLVSAHEPSVITCSPEALVVGAALSSIHDLPMRATAAWSRLMPQRDRSRHWRADPIGNPPSSGLFLAVWLRHALVLLTTQGKQPRELWFTLEQIAREGRLAERSNPGGVEWSSVQAILAATWPLVFTNDPDKDRIKCLTDFLAPFALPDEAFANLTVNLRKNGTTVEEIARVCGGVERTSRLLRIALEEMEERHRQEFRPEPDPLDQVRNLVREFETARAVN